MKPVWIVEPDNSEPSTPDQLGSSFLKPKCSYNYDMTYYISHANTRFIDASHMAHLIDSTWRKHLYNGLPAVLEYPQVTFAESFHGTRRCLSFLKTPKDIFNYYFKMCQIVAPSCIDEMLNSDLNIVLPYFSFLKSFIHKHIDELPPISYCYSELDTIAGYPEQDHRALPEDATAWLTDSVNDLHSDKWWADEVFSLLNRSRVSQTDLPIRFIDYVKSPWLWVTSGAASQSKLLLDEEKIKTKFGAALSLTTNELLQAVLHSVSPNSVNIDIFVKADERGFKRRLIANMDLGSYLVAGYIRYLLEWLNGPLPSWMTATTSPNKDLNIVKLLRRQARSVPLDESKFDHHVSRAAWLGFITAMKTLFPDNFGIDLFEVMFNNSLYRTEDGQKQHWFKGMPSGLAITSLCNTLFNYVKQQHLLSSVHFALGDDVLLFPEFDYSLEQISKYYSTFGAEVNVLKNWESNKYAEYLHFLYSRHGRVGIPARIYGSLIYAMQFKDTTPLQRINELTQLFKDFYDRSCLPMDEDLVAGDLARAVSKRWAGFSKATAREWLHIPKALNGYGLLPYSNNQFQVRTLTHKTLKYRNNLYDLNDVVKPIVTEWKIVPYRLNNAVFQKGSTLHMPQPQNIEEWVARLNFDVPGYSKTQLQYAHEVIPLPEIPYVSTSRMSQFASTWKYNAYPNISGSAVSRTTRFIKGSLLLADQVQSWLRTNAIYVYV